VRERERKLVHPLHVVEDEERRLELAQRPVRGLEHSHRLEGGRRLEQDRVDLPSVLGCVRERAQQRRRRCERHVPFGLVADDAKGMVETKPALGLRQEPALAAPRLSDDERCREAVASRAVGDVAQRSELVRPADKRRHLSQRTPPPLAIRGSAVTADDAADEDERPLDATSSLALIPHGLDRRAARETLEVRERELAQLLLVLPVDAHEQLCACGLELDAAEARVDPRHARLPRDLDLVREVLRHAKRERLGLARADASRRGHVSHYPFFKYPLLGVGRSVLPADS
jgi:hypothetical protein